MAIARPDLKTAGPRGPFSKFVSSREDGAGSAKQSGEPARILLVEDDYLVATSVEGALIDEGLALIGVAATADEAVQLAHTFRPSLIIMDVRLRGKRDGVDVAIKLRRDLEIGCIFATAHYDDEVRRRAEAAAPLGWMKKPYEPSSLVKMVKETLRDLSART